VGATRTALTLTLILTSVALRTRGDAARGTDFPSPQLVPGVVRELATGKLLIAARNLPDGNFAESVILLADYSTEGAMGLIINRRTEIPLARAFPQLKTVSPEARIYAGGPVATTRMVGLLRARTAGQDLRRIGPEIYMVTTREPLEGLIASGANPDHFRVYFGYAGWAPGQLEREAIDGAWHVVPADAALVFDPDPSSVWRREIRRTEGLMAAR
jgi:putative transcriptional regulator